MNTAGLRPQPASLGVVRDRFFPPVHVARPARGQPNSGAALRLEPPKAGEPERQEQTQSQDAGRPEGP